MMELPEDAVSEILLRLPVKSLLRFRSVCKKWFAQINSPLFREKHLAYRLAIDDDEELILVKKRYYWDTPNFKDIVNCFGDYESPGFFDIGSSCLSFFMHVNGLVCFTQFFEEGCKFNIILGNPALREFRKLSFSEIPVFNDINAIERKAVGFGFDDATKDYVVAQIFSLEKKNDHKCVVYHLRTKSWLMVEMPAFVSATTTYFNNGVICSSFFSHGSIHWCIVCKPNYRILTLNTTSKLFQEIEFPHGWKDYSSKEHPYLYKVDSSCIALVSLYFKQETFFQQVLDVWVMKEYGNRDSWIKLYSISDLPLLKKPLSLWRKDRLLLPAVDGSIMCYDLSKGKIRKLGRPDTTFVPYANPDLTEVVTCYSSLVSIEQSLK